MFGAVPRIHNRRAQRNGEVVEDFGDVKSDAEQK